MNELSRDPKFADVRVFKVDYSDKPTLKALGVADRSTLVGYRGAAERKRSSFETDRAAIQSIFESTR